jgi:hypothetical protein
MATALERLAEATRIAATRPQLVNEAREEKATWEQIAEAAGMSRAGVIKLSKTGTNDAT